MWWNEPSLIKCLIDNENIEWNFKIWHDIVGNEHIQRIYFWNSTKATTGIVEFKNNQTLHKRKLKDRCIKISKDKNYRSKFLCGLQFPLEKYY